MLTSLHSFFLRWARWPVIVALVLLSAFWMTILSNMDAASNLPSLDTRLWYTPAQVRTLMDALTPAQRDLAARAHLTLDVLFPSTYGSLLAMLLLKTWPQSSLWKLALADVAADLMENVTLATLYWTHPRLLDTLVPLAAWWTALKWTLIALTFVFILLGAFNRWRVR